MTVQDATKFSNIANFDPKKELSDTSKFFAKVVSVGNKLTVKVDDFHLIGNEEKLIFCESVTLAEGDMAMGSVDFCDYFKVPYVKGWRKPEDVTISFIDDDTYTLYSTFHKIAKDTKVEEKMGGISPTQIHNYSIKIEFTRYDKRGNSVYKSEYTLFPKTLPQWTGSYGSSAKFQFDMNLSVIDYKVLF
jgi:hypothetical protein